MKTLKLYLFCTFLFNTGLSNNFQIKNVQPLAENTIGHYRYIQFDIGWENSWRRDNAGQDYYAEPYNWDAAWVFIKYQVNFGEWKHCTLSKASSEHIAPIGSKIDAVSDGMGIFIYKNSNGIGSNNFTSVLIRWNYGIDGLPDGSNITGIKVPGIEMVYISHGSFYAGDNEFSDDSFRAGSNDKSPWHITSENAINVTNTSSGGYYYVTNDYGNNDDSTGSVFIIPASFPKGYKAIYCMKCEISQGQYADFLNLLDSTQASNRYPNGYGYQGYTINFSEGKYFVTNPDRACNMMEWADGIAYADWSGLRPMTELEYEKICRGPKVPVAREYSWGSTNITDATTISGIEDGTEKTINSDANCCYRCPFSRGYSGDGPLRVGIFASRSSSREQSGASYYGVMEMSGNLWERCVTVGNLTSRSFIGFNGDGSLNSSGQANIGNWQGTNASSQGYRGGGWDSYEYMMRVSNRNNAAFRNGYWLSNIGFRCVRFAP